MDPNAEPAYRAANSPIVLLARMMAPARFIRSTVVASRCDVKSLKTTDPKVVGIPPASI